MKNLIQKLYREIDEFILSHVSAIKEELFFSKFRLKPFYRQENKFSNSPVPHWTWLL